MVFKRSPCYAALGKYASSGIVPLLVNRFPHNLHTFLLSNVGTILLFLCLSPYYTHSSFSLWDWKWCGTWNKPFCGSFFFFIFGTLAHTEDALSRSKLDNINAAVWLNPLTAAWAKPFCCLGLFENVEAFWLKKAYYLHNISPNIFFSIL